MLVEFDRLQAGNGCCHIMDLIHFGELVVSDCAAQRLGGTASELSEVLVTREAQGLWEGDRLRVWEGYHESKRCSRDTYPESYTTKYTSIRRLMRHCKCGNVPFRKGSGMGGPGHGTVTYGQLTGARHHDLLLINSRRFLQVICVCNVLRGVAAA